MTTKGKFLHLSPLAIVGGCEVNCLRLIEGLSDHDHEVVVFDQPGPMSDQWIAAGASVTHLGAWRAGAGKFQAAFGQWVKSSSAPEGIFIWSTSRLPIVLGTLREWEAPTVVHLGNPLTGAVLVHLRRWWQERGHVADQSITLVACSNHVAASHRQAFYFREFPLEVIYNPVAPRFDGPRHYRRLASGEKPVVGMMARLDAIKDHVTLIRSVAQVAALVPDLVVELAGDGELKAELEREVERLDVSRHLRFLGFAEAVPTFKAWDIYVHSTTAREGMGTAVAEAMMTGLPCIVSDLAVMREVCGDAAIFVPPGDPAALAQALIRLAGDFDLRRSLGIAAQWRAREMFALPAVAAAYRHLASPRRVGT